MKLLLPAIAALCAASTVSAYTQADVEAAHKFVEDAGFPVLGAFKKMTPKMLRTVLEAYGRVTNADAFEYLTALDLEILYTATSASNNCELCLSFHAAALKDQLPAADIEALLHGGLPSDKRARALAIAAKYALAHKGAMLPREKVHLAAHGFDSEEKILEVIYAVGFMSANNMAYIHMIANGMEVEDFLQKAGPFKHTVYAGDKAEL